jgi:hypothetical protein
MSSKIVRLDLEDALISLGKHVFNPSQQTDPIMTHNQTLEEIRLLILKLNPKAKLSIVKTSTFHKLV